jgi:predicted porin
MQKKLIALAIASAMAAPGAALADVTIYGKMDVSYNFLDHDQAAGSAFDSDNQSINSNSSRLGFKGSEDLGGGLKANFQIESAITVDGGGGGLNQRNTWAGLSGDWGEVRLGRHDTPFKIAGRKTDFYESEQLGENRTVFNNRVAGPGYDVRAGETIAYLTPKFSGFQAVAAYVPEEGVNDGDAFSIAGFYGNGPLFLTLAYEMFDNGNFGGGAADEQTAWRLGGKYSFGDFTVSGLYQDGSDEGGVSGLDHDAWWLGGQYSFGNNDLSLTYGEKDYDDVAGITNDTSWDVWTLGLDHNFSKRTKIYARYASLDNDSGAAMTLDSNGFDNGDGNSDRGVMRAGGDSSGFSFGMRHKF